MWNSNTVAASVGLIGFGVLLVLAYYAIVHARSVARGIDRDRPMDRLAELRAAYEAGQMSTEEFERVRLSLDGRGVSKAAEGVSKPSASAPAEAPATVEAPGPDGA